MTGTTDDEVARLARPLRDESDLHPLIDEQDLGLVAVEGDWPDRHRVNRSVGLRPGADEHVPLASGAV